MARTLRFLLRNQRFHPPQLMVASLKKILKGCELLFHTSIMSYDNVDELCIEGTIYILIELNYTRLWGLDMVNAIERFADKFNLKPIIVHIERYSAIKKKPNLQKSYNYIEKYLGKEISNNLIKNAKNN